MNSDRSEEIYFMAARYTITKSENPMRALGTDGLELQRKCTPPVSAILFPNRIFPAHHFSPLTRTLRLSHIRSLNHIARYQFGFVAC